MRKEIPAYTISGPCRCINTDMALTTPTLTEADMATQCLSTDDLCLLTNNLPYFINPSLPPIGRAAIRGDVS